LEASILRPNRTELQVKLLNCMSPLGPRFAIFAEIGEPEIKTLHSKSIIS